MCGKSSAGLMLIALVAAGCAHEQVLRPAPEARTVQGRRGMAFDRAAGVNVWADGDAWDAYPRDLEDVITPVWLYIDNNSGHPIRVRYQDVTLLSESGFRYSALPPFSLSSSRREMSGRVLASRGAGLPAPGQTRVRVGVGVHSHFRHQGFYVAPHYRGFYPYDPWPYHFAYDPFYHDHYYDDWTRALPTRDMLARAFPEGAIEDEGVASGFFYFQRVDESGGVSLEMELVDAKSDEHLGTIRIPFVVAQS